MPVSEYTNNSELKKKAQSCSGDTREYNIALKKIPATQDHKDERLLFLLVLGLFLFLIFGFRQLPSSVYSSGEHEKLQVNGKTLFLGKYSLTFQKKDRISAIPALLRPFFYAPVPINSADQQLLETISGIGLHLSQEILRTRTSKGPFKSPHDLLRVHGIGPKKVHKFADKFSYEVAKPIKP